MVFGRTALSILRGAKAYNGFQHVIAHSSRSRIYSASRDSTTRLALRRPFASHRVENSGKDQGDVAASSEGVKKVHKFFVLPCHQNGGLTLTDLKAEIAKVLGSYDLAEKFSYRSFDNDFNSITATLTEDQVELIKKSLKVISVMDDSCLKLHSFHEVENSGKGEGYVAASEASVDPKVQKTFLLPSPRHGGLNLSDLKAEIAKILGSYDLAQECSFYSYENQFNYFLATLTEDQVELIKKSLEVISVMEDNDVESHRM